MNDRYPILTGLSASIAGKTVDTPPEVSDMTASTTAASEAKQYKVCQRTIFRWRRAGVDTSSPLAVAQHLTGLRATSADALERVAAILSQPSKP